MRQSAVRSYYSLSHCLCRHRRDPLQVKRRSWEQCCGTVVLLSNTQTAMKKHSFREFLEW